MTVRPSMRESRLARHHSGPQLLCSQRLTAISFNPCSMKSSIRHLLWSQKLLETSRNIFRSTSVRDKLKHPVHLFSHAPADLMADRPQSTCFTVTAICESSAASTPLNSSIPKSLRALHRRLATKGMFYRHSSTLLARLSL
jgi:hypothetical protein